MADRRQTDRRSGGPQKINISLSTLILTILIFVVMIISVFVTAYFVGISYEEGYNLGYEEASATSYKKGYTAGYQVGIEANQNP